MVSEFMAVQQSLDLHAFPERDSTFDFASRLARLRVIPDGVRIHLAVDHQAVVIRLPFPGATRAVVAEGDVLLVQAAFGKVVVPFHNDGVVALSDDGAVPDGFHSMTPV